MDKSMFTNMVWNQNVRGFYTSKGTTIVEGDFRERHFVIRTNRIGCPVVYAEATANDAIGCDPTMDYCEAFYHLPNEITYFGTAYWNEEDKRTYVGWDHCHNGDYMPTAFLFESANLGDHQYTVDEVLNEIVESINALLDTPKDEN